MRHDLRLEPVLRELNEPQLRAVTHRDGPLLVLAGPGSGKTRVITRRAAYLVHTGIPPRNVLAITFTNKAAGEMRRRIEELGVGAGMWVYTFHALGARLIREFGALARIQPGFTIYDEDDRLRCVKEAMSACSIEPHLLRPEQAQAEISRAKNGLQTVAEFEQRASTYERRMIARVYAAYEQLLEQRNAVDFDDLLMRTALVLRDHPDVTERLNVRFRHVLIDEYQDTNHAQYLIARYLSMHHRNVCATGDPDQSIYGWRGADIGNILEFERDYPDAVVVRLEQNYRSTRHILAAASTLISFNRKRKRKDLWTENAHGDPVHVWVFGDGRDEAERIAEAIASHCRRGRRYGDFAVFYRVNAVSRGLEEAFRHRGIPYRIARGVEFYSRREIRDVLAYLRVLVNPHDEVALLRIINTPARGIGKTTVERLVEEARASRRSLLDVVQAPGERPKLSRAAAGHLRDFIALLDKLRLFAFGGVSDAVANVLTMSGLEDALRSEREAGGEDRLANVQELVTAAARYEDETEEPSLADFLARSALVSDQDTIDESLGVVMLMTLHAAKGLEFPIVFLAGVEQGMLPHERAIREGDIEEERRLCFVGITRAREKLYITHARQRELRGQLTPRSASQFLHELGDAAVEHQNFAGTVGAMAPGRPVAGFEALDEEAIVSRFAARRSASRPRHREEEPIFTADDPAGAAPDDLPAAYRGWAPGTLVRHAAYGVGTLEWIRPSGAGRTRARIQFARYGAKTFVLERAPIDRAGG